MATIDDLEKISITDMSPDEAIEYLRQIRLSRRTPVSKPKSTTTRKSRSTKTAAPNITSANDAEALLKILTGE